LITESACNETYGKKFAAGGDGGGCVDDWYPHFAGGQARSACSAPSPCSSAGLLLRGSEFVSKAVAADAVPKDAIVQSSAQASALSGALLRHPLSRGAVITGGDVFSPNAPGFLAAALKPAMRAVSVAITDVSGNAGLIQPDDHIDLLLTQTLRDSKSPSASVASETIATNIRVIAVGSSFKRQKDGADSTSGSGYGPARTITLEVTPRAAEVIAVAARLGDLSMSLRSFAINDPKKSDDTASTLVSDSLQLNDSGPVWAGDISQATRSIKPEKKDTPPVIGEGQAGKGVLVLRGSTDAKTQAPAPAADAMNIGSRLLSLTGKAAR